MELIDETTITRDGIGYRVMILPDYDSSPDDADTYSAGDLATYAAGDWQFVGVIVRPVIEGDEIRDADDSLWGVQYGTNPEWDHELSPGGTVGLDYIVNVYPVPGMVSEVRGNLAQLFGKLAGLSLDDCGAYNPAESRGDNVANASCLRAAGHDGPHRDSDGREF